MRIRTSTVLGVAVAIVFAWSGVAVVAYFALPDWQSRGQFGDVFGAVNALFSGLAFAGLIFAILLQREDLELQREELALTREELSRSARAQEQSETALRAQADAAARTSRLATINFLLDHYKQEMEGMRKITYPGGHPQAQRLAELQSRQAVLIQQLDLLYGEVIPNEQSGERIQNR